MRVTFTRQSGCRYGVDVIRESGPPARLRVVKSDAEWLPREIAHFLVEREFGLKLGIFGQLAAGGDAGRFWAAPADRDSRLAHLSHRLQVTGRGDLGRSVALVAWCTAAYEIETGRRPAGPVDPRRVSEPRPHGHWDPRPTGHYSRPTGHYSRPTGHYSRPDGHWPLFDVAALPCEQVAGAVRCLAATAVAWSELHAGQRMAFDWPLALTLTARRSA